jgi:hypothetical protein
MLSKDDLLDHRGRCIKEAARLRREADRLAREAEACLRLAREAEAAKCNGKEIGEATDD